MVKNSKTDLKPGMTGTFNYPISGLTKLTIIRRHENGRAWWHTHSFCGRGSGWDLDEAFERNFTPDPVLPAKLDGCKMSLRELQANLAGEQKIPDNAKSRRKFEHALMRHPFAYLSNIVALVNDNRFGAEMDAALANLLISVLDLANDVPGRVVDLHAAVEKRVGEIKPPKADPAPVVAPVANACAEVPIKEVTAAPAQHSALGWAASVGDKFRCLFDKSLGVHTVIKVLSVPGSTLLDYIAKNEKGEADRWHLDLASWEPVPAEAPKVEAPTKPYVKDGVWVAKVGDKLKALSNWPNQGIGAGDVVEVSNKDDYFYSLTKDGLAIRGNWGLHYRDWASAA